MFQFSNLRRCFLASCLSLITLVAATACGSSPTAPTPRSPGVFVTDARPADLGACLGGSGDASCFTASAVSAPLDRIGPAVVNSPPTNLTASVNGNTVVLTWTPPATGDPVGAYVIEAGSAPGLANLANVVISATPSLTVPGVPNGTYYVRVRAANNSGVSPPSNEIVVVVGACAGPPRSLGVVAQSAGTISIAWQPPAAGSPTSYVIFAGSSPGLSNLVTFDTASPATSLVVPNVPAGSYYVRVSSLSSCGLSAPSNEVLVFAVAVAGDVQVSVSWDAPSDVDLHVVEPSGQEIFYGNPTSSTGGQLDVDSNAACSIDGRQIENIRWSGRAPAGQYIVRVDYWDSCDVGRTNYLVTVRQGASTRTFPGLFTGEGDHGGAGSGVTITTFVQAASEVLREAAPSLFRAPDLFMPSPKKLKMN
jgi:hypothetical protein